MITYETMLGTVTLTEAYLSKLIGQEVTACFGVVAMKPRSNRQRLFQLFSRKETADTGIRVSGTIEAIRVEIHLAVSYGTNINAIANSITEKVEYAVKEATGIEVEKVIVKIDGMNE